MGRDQKGACESLTQNISLKHLSSYTYLRPLNVLLLGCLLSYWSFLGIFKVYLTIITLNTGDY